MTEDRDDKMSRPCEEVLRDETRGPLALDIRFSLRHPIGLMRATGSFLIAHHPLCSDYEDHSFSLGSRRFCIGCFFNTLFFVISMGSFGLLYLIDPTLLVRFYLFWGGVLVVAAYFLIGKTGITENFRAKVFTKFLLGSAFASVCWSILLADGLETDFVPKVLFILILYFVVLTILSIKHGTEIIKTCEDCEYKMRWSRCPGLKDTVCRLVEEGYLKPESVDDQ